MIDSFQKWLDACTTYMMVIVGAFPSRALDTIHHQQIISSVVSKCRANVWQQFHHRAAYDLSRNWGQIDLRLWTVTLSGLAKPHCLVCSSLYHNQSSFPDAEHSGKHSSKEATWSASGLTGTWDAISVSTPTSAPAAFSCNREPTRGDDTPTNSGIRGKK